MGGLGRGGVMARRAEKSSAEMTAEQLVRLEKMLADRLAAPDREVMLIRERRTGVMVSMFGEDRPTKERLQHGRITAQPMKVGREMVTALRETETAATPLPKYRRENQIDDWQLKAGLVLHSAFIRAGLTTRVVSRYAERGNGGGNGWEDVSAQQVFARREYAAALNAVHYRFRPVLIHVCCLGFPASDWAAGNGVPGRSSGAVGVLTLRYGLDDLVDHYGLKKSG